REQPDLARGPGTRGREEGEIGSELLRLLLARDEQDHLAARRLFDETRDEHRRGRRVQSGECYAAAPLPCRLLDGRAHLAVRCREIKERTKDGAQGDTRQRGTARLRGQPAARS